MIADFAFDTPRLYGEYEKYQFPRFATDHGYGYQKLCSTQYGAQQAQSGHAHMAGYDSMFADQGEPLI